MLKEFGMKDSRLKYVPLAPSIQLTMDIQFPPIEMKYYYIIVVKLIFLTTTQPNLAYTVETVS
jgi:hypothetical protein